MTLLAPDDPFRAFRVFSTEKTMSGNISANASMSFRTSSRVRAVEGWERLRIGN